MDGCVTKFNFNVLYKVSTRPHLNKELNMQGWEKKKTKCYPTQKTKPKSQQKREKLG
jgi:hypothetical protein